MVTLHDPRWERWAGWGGVLFAALSIIWVILIVDTPGLDDSTAELAAYYANDDNHPRLWVANVVLSLAGIFLLWFLGSLRTLLRRAEGGDGRLSAVTFGAGLAMVALLLAKNAVKTAPVIGAGYAEELGGDSVRTLEALTEALLGVEGAAAAAVILFTSVVALRTGVLPRWLGWLGVPLAIVVLLLGLVFTPGPLILFLVWVVVVGVLIARSFPRARTAPET